MAKFSYLGEVFDLIEERYTLGEVDGLERHIGIKFSEFSNPDNAELLKSTRGTITLLWISAKRVHPTLTFDQVSEWVLDDVEFMDDGPDPTQPQPGESVSESTSTRATSPSDGTGPRKKSKR